MIMNKLLNQSSHLRTPSGCHLLALGGCRAVPFWDEHHLALPVGRDGTAVPRNEGERQHRRGSAAAELPALCLRGPCPSALSLGPQKGNLPSLGRRFRGSLLGRLKGWAC